MEGFDFSLQFGQPERRKQPRLWRAQTADSTQKYPAVKTGDASSYYYLISSIVTYERVSSIPSMP